MDVHVHSQSRNLFPNVGFRLLRCYLFGTHVGRVGPACCIHLRLYLTSRLLTSCLLTGCLLTSGPVTIRPLTDFASAFSLMTLLYGAVERLTIHGRAVGGAIRPAGVSSPLRKSWATPEQCGSNKHPDQLGVHGFTPF